MITTENLIIGWLMYGFASLGLLLVLWKITHLFKLTLVRVWITLSGASFLFQPWFSPEPDGYVAPAIIVAVFSFLDSIDLGVKVALENMVMVLIPALVAILVISTVVVIWAFIKFTTAPKAEKTE